MSRKTITTVVAVLVAIGAVLSTEFGLTLKLGGAIAALGAAVLYVRFEAAADKARLRAQASKWSDPKFWITMLTAVIAALPGAGVTLPISPEIIITVLTVIVGVLFKKQAATT